MEHKFNAPILIPVFIILLVIIFRTIKDSLKFDDRGSLILSICVSVLATIGLNGNIQGTTGTILIPYESLGICILLAFLISFLLKSRKNGKDNLFDIHKKDPQSGVDEKRIFKIDDDRKKR